MVKITGLDKLNKKFKELEKLGKPEKVSLNELFNESFMQKNTKFNSIDELFDKFNISSLDDIEKNIEAIDQEIKVNSHFVSFEEMKNIAAKEHVSKKIKKIFK